MSANTLPDPDWKFRRNFDDMSTAAQVHTQLEKQGMTEGEDFLFAVDHIDDNGRAVFALYFKESQG